jgi:hypothetical protein
MIDWPRERSIDCKRRPVERTHLRFCLADIEIASAFQVAFGGELAVVEPKRPKLKAWQW